jgi:hypothetical protein
MKMKIGILMKIVPERERHLSSTNWCGSTSSPRWFTTQESKKGSPKLNIPLQAMVFKSENRLNLPPPTLWRGSGTTSATGF